jgi:hypothetical protein
VTHSFDAELWQWQSETAPPSWYFVTVPPEFADDVRLEAGPPSGFGSVRVEVTVGRTTWRTSLFPSKDEGSYVLPVKKAVRVAEHLDEGGVCSVVLRVVEPAGC